jgi:hypothetical protein
VCRLRELARAKGNLRRQKRVMGLPTSHERQGLRAVTLPKRVLVDVVSLAAWLTRGKFKSVAS